MRGGKWRWWKGQGSQRERSTHACMAMTMGWNETNTRASWAIVRCARDECANTELTTKTATPRARSRVHVVLRVDSLYLGFHFVIGVGRLNVQQDGFFRQLHFTTQTQHKVQSSFLLDVVVRLCPVIVHSICIPNSCKILIAKTGLLRCCLFTPPVGYSRPPSAVNDLSVTK